MLMLILQKIIDTQSNFVGWYNGILNYKVYFLSIFKHKMKVVLFYYLNYFPLLTKYIIFASFSVNTNNLH